MCGKILIFNRSISKTVKDNELKMTGTLSTTSTMIPVKTKVLENILL